MRVFMKEHDEQMALYLLGRGTPQKMACTAATLGTGKRCVPLIRATKHYPHLH